MIAKIPEYQIKIEELCRNYLQLAKARDDYSVEMLVIELKPQIIEIVETELRQLDDRWAESEKILNREAAYNERSMQSEVEYWKGRNYELGGR